MAQKLTFSARKDPLLRPRKSTERQQDAAATPDARGAAAATKPPASTPAPARERTGSASRARPRSLAAVEEPAGVIAVATASSTEADPPANAADNSRDTPTPTARERSRHSARRVQTSMSFPPGTWDALDEVGETAGASAGELLIAILNDAIPETPADALAAVEQLLISSAPADDGPHEERNYRLPLDLRTRLDELTKALGPQVQRSLLIRALLAAHAPQNAEAARRLLTTQRIQAMRSAVSASAAG
jgi:hypothetical protein